MKKSRFSIKSMMMSAACVLLLMSQPDANACTGIQLQTEDGTYVSGRTLEFGISFDIGIIVVPRNYEFVGQTTLGDGKKWKTKYASVGAMLADNAVILDGINEKGLSVGSFYFPGFAKYSVTTPENQLISMSSSDITQWIVSQFATVDEVRAAIENGEVAISPVLTPGFPPEVQPFHFVVYDKSGKSLVIEPIDGKLVLYDNPLGTMANSPTFDWHMTNLRNYVALNPNNVPPVSIFGQTFKQLGQGSGMLGLPGDFTPPSRFVRAAVFSATAIPEKSAEKGIQQVFHILNNFDIPVGVAREKHEGVIHSDYTMLTVARDSKNLRYFYNTYDDQTLRMVDLSKFDLDAKSIKKISAKSDQPIVDMTDMVK
ncbi:MAG: choloylglycine hydrolase family protein [Thermodesulfobacteriota bacterium]|nr:choloylglycine hydrolase family protein [Thermodesulfobacteriota bacterium]